MNKPKVLTPYDKERCLIEFYIEQGLSIFPILPKSKTPAVDRRFIKKESQHTRKFRNGGSANLRNNHLQFNSERLWFIISAVSCQGIKRRF